MYDEKGNLTHAGMQAVIKSGGSVTYKNHILSTIESLPSPEDLATNDEQRAAVGDDIDAEIARLQARKARLATAATPAAPVKPAPAAHDDEPHAPHAKAHAPHAKK